MTKNGKTLTDQDDIDKRWSEYLADLYTDKNTYGPNVLTELFKRSGADREHGRDGILLEEVKNAIRKLKDNKSPGPDDIPAELIKAGGEPLAREVHKICCEIWETEKWPKDWCKSTIVMLPKKGNLKECGNYRSIALIPHMCKVMLNILQDRLKSALEGQISEEQGGFRKDRSTVQQILTLRLIAEEITEKGKDLYHCFIDFKKAFDSVWHDGLWASLGNLAVPEKLIRVTRSLYEQSEMAVRTGQSLGSYIKANIGSRQGDPMSPMLFIAILEKVMERMECADMGGINIQGEVIKDLRFADDIDLLATSEKDLQDQMCMVHEDGESMGLHINIEKTKVLVMGSSTQAHIEISGEMIECVEQFVYLGSLITRNNDCSKEIQRRIGIASSVFGSMKEIWGSQNISLRNKLRILDCCVFSSLLYACETWTLKKQDERRLLACEMRCYRRILKISWTRKVKNDEVRKRVGRTSTLMERIKKRKLGLFGHICRMRNERIIKLVMLGMSEGVRKQGRPRRRWLDDIKDWCGVTLPEAVRMAEERRGCWRQKR